MTEFIQPYTSLELSEMLNCELRGQNILVDSVSPLSRAGYGSLTFLRGEPTEEFYSALAQGATVISSKCVHLPDSGAVLVSTHPEEDLALFLAGRAKPNLKLFKQREDSLNVQIHESAVIHRNVLIESDCLIKAGSILGAPGFGLFKGRSGEWHHFPHVGGVIIGRGVEIGALSSVASGTVAPTVVSRNTKIDDHCHIAHNVRIGERVVICAGTVISGSVTIGDDVWIGPGTTLMNGVSICDRVFLGIGSLVMSDINKPGVYYGRPAKFVREN